METTGWILAALLFALLVYLLMRDAFLLSIHHYAIKELQENLKGHIHCIELDRTTTAPPIMPLCDPIENAIIAEFNKPRGD